MRMTLVLAGAIAVAAGLGFRASRPKPDAVARAESAAVAPANAVLAPALPSEPEAPSEGNATTLQGEVLETLAVNKYTYLRLSTANGPVWAAVPSASIATGSHVTVVNAARMDDFKSATLGRTFKLIYFGNLAKGSAVARAPELSATDEPELADDTPLPPGHPNIGALGSADLFGDDSNTLPPGHPDISGDPAEAMQDGNATHAAVSAEAREPVLPARQIDRAAGANAHSISELLAGRQKLAGQRVRVRAEVTKVTPDVQGHAFFHLRDGNPGPGGQAADLAVTSSVEPKRGQVATFEGTLRADVDIGIGYKYPMLLENATQLAE